MYYDERGAALDRAMNKLLAEVEQRRKRLPTRSKREYARAVHNETVEQRCQRHLAIVTDGIASGKLSKKVARMIMATVDRDMAKLEGRQYYGIREQATKTKRSVSAMRDDEQATYY